jgi:hypothetical protein
MASLLAFVELQVSNRSRCRDLVRGNAISQDAVSAARNRRWLLSHGCRLGQGFLYAHLDSFEVLLKCVGAPDRYAERLAARPALDGTNVRIE